MTSPNNQRLGIAATFLIALIAALPVAVAEPAPQAVSPGAPGSVEPLAGSCPTFSWSGVENAAGYELVLYRVSASGALETALQAQVPGGATSWTPSAAECPASGSSSSGNQYAWAVRAVGEDGAGAWSQPLQFSTPGTPTEDEVRQALATLRRYRADRAAAVGEGLAPSRGEPTTSTPGRAQAQDPRLRTDAVDPASRSGSEALSTSTLAATPSPATVTAPAQFSLNLSGDVELGGFVFKEGAPFIHNNGGAAYRNTAVGLHALESLTLPNLSNSVQNTAFGYGALRNDTTGSQNTAVGLNALSANETGSSNTALGWGTLEFNGGFRNTAVGSRALRSNTTGARNTATGVQALSSNDTGNDNTGVGYRALWGSAMIAVKENTAIGSLALRDNEADANTAVGFRTLLSNTSGYGNSALGWKALEANEDGFRNTAIGERALWVNTGSNNVAVGVLALSGNMDGARNTAIGYRAGELWESGSNNIAVGYVLGTSSDDGVIRIGFGQTSTFVAGIDGANIGSADQVFINSSDQLGTITSSARFKHDIHDLEGVSDRLLDLRPVSFRYKDDSAESSEEGAPNPLEYGLIAEEVAEVFPELVLNDEEGRPYTVRYHLLTPLLLGEIQRQDGALAQQDRELADLRRQMADRDQDYRKAVADLERRLERLAKKRRWWRGDGGDG